MEIIKYGITHRSIGYLQLGDVEQVHDQILRKSVFRIRGSVAATNYLRVPRHERARVHDKILVGLPC